MKRISTLLIICLFIGLTATAQQLERLQEDDFVLSIAQAEIDGEDYTDVYLKNNALLTFYERNDTLYFANVWQKAGSQSYGEITVLASKEYSNRKYPTETVSFLWEYANTYNDKVGIAIVILRITHRPVSSDYELSILTESTKLLSFKGYVNGRLNWKPYF